MEPEKQLSILGVYVCDEKVASTERSEVEAVLEGIVGDRHYGTSKKAGVREQKFHTRGTEIWNSRQWSAVSIEELEAIAHDIGLPEIRPDWVGANMLLSGDPNFSKLPPLSRLVFPSGATLLVYGANQPCNLTAGSIQEKTAGVTDDHKTAFVCSARNRRGLVGWVERAGVIRPGDTVLVYPAKNG
jgi:hypothetical protein